MIMSDTDTHDDAPVKESASVTGLIGSASNKIEYILPCAHIHRGKMYKKGDTLMLRPDQVERIEGNLQHDAVITETGGDH